MLEGMPVLICACPDGEDCIAVGTDFDCLPWCDYLREIAPEHNPCEGCKFYNQPYWSIISPCRGCPLA